MFSSEIGKMILPEIEELDSHEFGDFRIKRMHYDCEDVK